jgi:hypothetical protein
MLINREYGLISAGRLIEIEFEVSVRGDINILGSRVSQKFKIQSETRDFN